MSEPTDAPTLALLRHGRTAWNRAQRLQGRSDQPLDEEGRAELADRRAPPPWDRARLVASPLVRARDTAALIAPGRPIETDERLIELDFGDWEGRRGADLLREPGSGYRHIEDWGWSFAPPGGEALTALRDRVSGFLADAAGRAEPVLAVCHINVMRVILAQAHGWDFDGPAPFQIKRARLYPIRLSADGRPAPAGDPIRLIRTEEPAPCAS